MDLADDIAYSTYDLEDTLKSGLLDPLNIVAKLAVDLDLQQTLVRAVRKAFRKSAIKSATISAKDVAGALGSVFVKYISSEENDPVDSYVISRSLAEDGYLRTQFTSSLVGQAVDGVRIRFNAHRPALSRVYLEPNDLVRVETLKQIAYLMIIQSNTMAVAEYRGSKIITDLFRMLSDEAHGGPALLPADVRKLHKSIRDKSQKKRVICDFIAGMTDAYALDFFNRLTGDTNTIFKPI